MIARFDVLLFPACRSFRCEYLLKKVFLQPRCPGVQDPIRLQDSALQVVHALDLLLHVSQVDTLLIGTCRI